MFHRPLYWRSKRNSPLDVHHKKITGTRVHTRRSKRWAKFGVAGEVLVSAVGFFTAKPGRQRHPVDRKKSNETPTPNHLISLCQDDTPVTTRRDLDPSLSVFESTDGRDIGLDVGRAANDL